MCYLQHVKSKFRLDMCQAVFFICNRVAVFLFQLWIQKRDRPICAEGVAVIVRNVVSESAERKRIAINVVGIVEKSQLGLIDNLGCPATLPIPAKIDTLLAPHCQRHDAIDLDAVRLPPMILAP